MTTIPAEHARREYEAYFRGPVGGLGENAYCFGTVDAYRNSLQFLGRLAEIPLLEDPSLDGDFGFVDAPNFTVQINDERDITDHWTPYNTMATALRGRVCEVELVTRITYADGSQAETSYKRRGICSRIVRRQALTILSFTNFDRAVLDKEFPFETYTVADFPSLAEDQTGWRITRMWGNGRKVPLVYLGTSGGNYIYGACYNSGGVNPVQTVYRGMEPGKGAVVPPNEWDEDEQTYVPSYTQGSIVGASTGVVVQTVIFPREQSDADGHPYVLEADISTSQWTASGTLSYVLAVYGYTIDNLAAAITQDNNRGCFADLCEGIRDRGRSGNAIVEDLLAITRGWLVPKEDSTTAFTLVQDIARTANYQFNARADLIQFEEYGDADKVPSTISLDFAPKAAGGNDYFFHMERTVTNGTGGVRKFENPYITNGTAGDKFLSYWQARLNSLKVAKATVYGVQLASTDLVNVVDNLMLDSGAHSFIVTANRRGPDHNEVELREYDASVYTYTPGTIPTAPLAFDGPDYGYTVPGIPASISAVNGGASVDADGKVTAYITIRAETPAGTNWETMHCLVTDTTTNEIYQAQLKLNGAYFEAVVSGLRPARAHQAYAWARNHNNIDGIPTDPISFTSATNGNVPDAPGSATIDQRYSFQLIYAWSAVIPAADEPPIDYYVVEEKQGAAAFTEIWRGLATTHVREGIATAVVASFRVKAVNKVGIESAWTTSVQWTVQRMIDDSYIISTGLAAPAIATAAVSQSKTNTSTSHSAGTLSPGQYKTVSTTNDYTFQVGAFGFDPQSHFYLAGALGMPSAIGNIGLWSAVALGGVTLDYDVRWRYFV